MSFFQKLFGKSESTVTVSDAEELFESGVEGGFVEGYEVAYHESTGYRAPEAVTKRAWQLAAERAKSVAADVFRGRRQPTPAGQGPTRHDAVPADTIRDVLGAVRRSIADAEGSLRTGDPDARPYLEGRLSAERGFAEALGRVLGEAGTS